MTQMKKISSRKRIDFEPSCVDIWHQFHLSLSDMGFSKDEIFDISNVLAQVVEHPGSDLVVAFEATQLDITCEQAAKLEQLLLNLRVTLLYLEDFS